MTQPSIKVGMIAEETGVLSIMGRANANVARMVVDEINAKGGLLGQKIELYLEDGATTDAVAQAKAAKLVAQNKVDVIFGGIYSSTRQAIKGPRRRGGQDTLYLPRAIRRAGMRPADLLHRSCAGAAARPAHSMADA
jgi:Periplasmic binding protein